MKANTFFILGCMLSLSGVAQNISVTFTGTGTATTIDSVTATNQRTNQSVSLPGNETLVLTINTGIPLVSELTDMGVVYPNPFTGRATFTTMVQKPQMVYLKVQNLMGQVIAQTSSFVRAGGNEFNLTLTSAGIYTVSLRTEQGTNSYKVICSGTAETESRIQYAGPLSGLDINLLKSGRNNLSTIYTLGYSEGDIILYRCRSGIYTTILTDSPKTSKNYNVEFVECKDPDGKNYVIVKIGDQPWMAENLAYLPLVSPSSGGGSNISPFYYVYGYEGTSVSQAKANTNYTTYGVLYNWEAARTACPSGWHLPNDEEWKILEMNQAMSSSEASGTGWRNSGSVGNKLKESGTSHWSSLNTHANNSSGFNALPGGYRYGSGGIHDLGDFAHFWSSSGDGSSNAWYRYLTSYMNGVGRTYDYRSSGFSVRCLKD